MQRGGIEAQVVDLKQELRNFWEKNPCGLGYVEGAPGDTGWASSLSSTRYELEPYIPEFARFPDGVGKDVLEIGVGLGADHREWARHHPRSLTGIDLTEAAIRHTRAALQADGLSSRLLVADAENLPFPDESFDLVYSWGVLHHSPDTPRAVREVWRVLRPGGVARVMIYYRYSLVGYMLYLRYGLLRGRPLTSLTEIFSKYVQGPGAKAYSVGETAILFSQFSEADIRVQLSFADLLEGDVGQRHRGLLLNTARALWPRRLLKRLCSNQGSYLLIDARK